QTSIGNVILSCLSKDPARRPQSAAQLKEALLHPSAQRPSIAIRKKNIVAIALGAVVVATILGAVYESFLFKQSTLEVQESSRTQAKPEMTSADNLLSDASARRSDLPADAVRNFQIITGHYDDALKLALQSKDEKTINAARAKLAHALVQAKTLTGI